ncbi:membrane protein [Bacteroidia bacterium]|nr:membrane protein [Bacteroidia bacterium]
MAKTTVGKQTVPEKKRLFDFAFGKINYIIMIAGLFVLLIGYLLMIGGKSTDPNVFDASQIFSTTRLTISPILIMLGFVIEIVAIMYRDKSK